MRQSKPKAVKLVKESKKASNENSILPLDTTIEVVREGDGNIVVAEMSYGQWLIFKKTPGFRYSAFQKGFSSFPGAIYK